MNYINEDLVLLVDKLTELYQPIFGHENIQRNISRNCYDRLIYIKKIYKLLSSKLNRPLKVLDLGCAQGFFSLHLSKEGATVKGIDFNKKNIAVCKALANENKGLSVIFEISRIEDVISNIKKYQYDLILGLSVFHHIVYEYGLSRVKDMLTSMAEKTKLCIFELALKEEPPYWSNSQAESHRDLLIGFSFVHEIESHKTHLSEIRRPLIIASNFYWYFDEYLDTFDYNTDESHLLSNGGHKGTRKYFFSKNRIIKLYRLDMDYSNENYSEINNEVNFLQHYQNLINTPKIITYGSNTSEAWIVRESIEGRALLDMIKANESYEPAKIISDILNQLVELEKLNLYHNDIRTWNVIVDNNCRSYLIDFGAISPRPNDRIKPENIFLSFFAFVKETNEQKIMTTDVRNINYDLDKLSEPYRSAFINLFLLPENEISFSRLKYFLIKQENYSCMLPSGFKIFWEAGKQQSDMLISKCPPL